MALKLNLQRINERLGFHSYLFQELVHCAPLTLKYLIKMQ